MSSYNYFLFVQFIRYFLIVFALMLGLVSAYLYFNPKQYWKIYKKSLSFKGISGAKPTKKFDRWVQISALVQIALSMAILFVLVISR